MKSQIAFFALSLIFGATAFAGGSSTVGPANPASVNCLKLTGVLEQVDTPAGTYDNCVVDEWQLFLEMSQRGLTHVPPSSGGANPAAVNCVQIGGELRSVTEPDGERGYCVIEEWKLFGVIDVVTKP